MYALDEPMENNTAVEVFEGHTDVVKEFVWIMVNITATFIFIVDFFFRHVESLRSGTWRADTSGCLVCGSRFGALLCSVSRLPFKGVSDVLFR